MLTPLVFPLSVAKKAQELKELKGESVAFLKVRNTSANVLYFSFDGTNWITVTATSSETVQSDWELFHIDAFWLKGSAANTTCEVICLVPKRD